MRPIAVTLVALLACAEPTTQPPPPPVPSSVEPEPAPTTEPPPEPSAPSEAPPPGVETVGDTTCAADADCAITDQQECCDCCASGPYATSAAWLAWRNGTLCKQTRCEPCGKVKCNQIVSPETLQPRCVAKSCAFEPKTP